MVTDNDKILLILDLDETLIHATKEEPGVLPDFFVFDYKVFKRPYVGEFLENMRKDFKLAIWSTASEDYIEKILSEITPRDIKFEFVWGQAKSTIKRMTDPDQGSYCGSLDGQYVKRLKKVKSLGFRLEKILIVDDSPDKLKENYGNAIYIKEFRGDSCDVELIHLEKYLISLKEAENVRNVEKRNWRSETLEEKE